MRRIGALLVWLAACSQPPAPGQGAAESAAQAEPAPTSQPVAEGPAPESQPVDDGYESTPPKVLPDGQEVYGNRIDPEVEEVALGALLSEPERYRDKVVKTQGTIARVCKNMGCWIELSGDGESEQIRAPMSGHSYFLPQKVIGKRATVQGTVAVRELTAAQKAHYAAEGAKATDVSVSIDATAVAVR